MDSKTLTSGTVLRHKDGGIDILSHRKEDDSGWWCDGGGGLADFVIERDDVWTVEELGTLNGALHRLLGIEGACTHGCTHRVFGTWTALGLANVAGRAGEPK